MTDELPGCTDHGCVFGHPGGMGTNMGCRCIPLHKPTPAERVELRRKIGSLRDRLRAAEEEAQRAFAAGQAARQGQIDEALQRLRSEKSFLRAALRVARPYVENMLAAAEEVANDESLVAKMRADLAAIDVLLR